MMPVALDVRHAEERHERQVLLHAQARLGGEVLGGHEVTPAGGIPVRTARRIQDGLVEPLAHLARDAEVPERPGGGKAPELRVGLVDDHGLDR